ncbi:MAG TPA: metallophosphoesterase [Candidatus Sulfopaludibacter sp.]|nr:metallophosphoesterase [Candidatus Sulfopaludibacter sp.]
MSRVGIPGQFAMVFGAFALAYMGTSIGVLALYAMFREVRKRLAPSLDPGRRRALNAMGSALMATPFGAVGYGVVHRTDFHVRELDVPIRGLAQDLDGLRILQISDIHLSPFLSESELARAIDASMGLRPHLTVVTGDLISQRGDPLDACIRQLARLKADAGVFGCMGNHERYARAEAYTERAAARIGIRFLRGASSRLRFGDATLNLVGVDHQSTAGGKQYLAGADRLVAPGAFNLLLSHNPDVFPVAARQGYNFVLSGHTHGGQVTVEILDQSISPARFFTPYVYGLYRAGDTAAYVTRGIGTIGIPARIGAPPEISLLRLRKA